MLSPTAEIGQERTFRHIDEGLILMNVLSILLFTVSLITSEMALGQDNDKCAPRKIHPEINSGESSKVGTEAHQCNA